ncbi:hypothetical protein [Treponema sp.]|uniref:hypothetical protein n=1 Tax=Treponema sp. TaxID=166 RepID=UPI00298D7C9C|nr:hypothetical protein [Treponema sp.]MCQ2240074.1 hypothetical protein [Treponema sp.]
MATTSNILTLLKYNCNKQKTNMLEYGQFADYIHRYAQHHIEENPDLVSYCSADYKMVLEAELNSLVADKQVAIVSIRNKDFLCCVPYFIEKYNEILTSIETNPLVPLPNVNELPKQVPHDILTKVEPDEIVYSRLQKEELDDKKLYCIVFGKNFPALLYPSNYPMERLVQICLKKVQELLHKEESHDYFLKKLTISNPGKELSIKNFFTQFVQNPQAALDVLKTSGDTFYYWSQMCYFLKQDYTKLKDFTPEDISILQSVAIIEVATSYHKSKTQERLAQEAAFEQLDVLMKNPPYYYNMADIVKMKDKNGIPLLGQYKEDQLKEHLRMKTTEAPNNQLPDLLVFKVSNDAGYYIYKEKVVPLILRLANDIRVLVREALIKSWYHRLLEYDVLPEMRENAAFEDCLEREIASVEPILHALLNSPFLQVVSLEDQSTGHIALYKDGERIPYSEILMVSRQEILADAKLKLPFWYSIPVISLILKLIFRKPKDKVKKNKKESVTLKAQEEVKEKEREEFRKRDEDDSVDPLKARRRDLRKAAMEIEAQFVPENSTLDRELKGYMHEWNDRIGKQNYENLGEDVDALIRDYFRKVLRTLKADTFNAERISHLAEALVDTPSMMKIKNHPALKRYVELYILKIVKNLPSN